MARKNNPVIGTQECFNTDCQATVEIMLTNEGTGNAMYICDGRADDKFCNARHHFGGQETRKMKRLAAEAERKTTTIRDQKDELQAKQSENGNANGSDTGGRTDGSAIDELETDDFLS